MGEVLRLLEIYLTLSFGNIHLVAQKHDKLVLGVKLFQEGWVEHLCGLAEGVCASDIEHQKDTGSLLQ